MVTPAGYQADMFPPPFVHYHIVHDSVRHGRTTKPTELYVKDVRESDLEVGSTIVIIVLQRTQFRYDEKQWRRRGTAAARNNPCLSYVTVRSYG
jgi:hypothetical protein